MQNLQADIFYSGLSGVRIDIPKYLFAPPFKNASRLTYYASLFDSIEINSSFYKIPQRTTVTKWAASVPDNFKFTFKLWKQITHRESFNFNEADVSVFLSTINSVQDKKRCLLIKFPPSLGKEYIVQLEQLLICIRHVKDKHWNLAIEFRNKSWYHEHVYDTLVK